MSTPTAFEGGCLCRAVRYRAVGNVVSSSLCHCITCRKAAGAPSVGWVVWQESDFSWIGETPSRFASSPGVVRTFCSRCGTPLTYQNALSAPGTIDVTTASLDNPDAFPPTMEIWTDHKLAWECLNPALPQHPRSSLDSSEPLPD